ncbi:hypothetical protein ACQ4LE_011095 [Meloidogyne hapla]
MGQSTCAFLKQKYPQFIFYNVPDEPRRVSDLSICHSNTPTCCTSQMEEEFSNLAESEFNQSVKSQIRLIHQFFSYSATNFKSHFKDALNNSMAALKRIFRKTYGQFYVQNKQIFNKFVNDSLLVFEQGNGCFTEALQQLFKRIFLTEFSILNPLRSVGEEKQQLLDCILSLFPILRPFGFGPEAISQLTGRAFRIWSSTIIALEQISRDLQILEKNFSAPKNCLPQLIQMRHCGICSGGNPSFQNGPYAGLCQKVYKQCINELLILDEQWRIFIDILIEISSYLLVHNPYIVFRPLPAQISDAIMYYQERGEIISNQIIFRCFGEKFEKLVVREKRQKEETDRETEKERKEFNFNYCNYSDFNSTKKRKSKKDYINFKTFNLKARTIKIAVESFKDKLLNIRGLWHSFPRLICREGGIQAKPGQKCWNGGDFSGVVFKNKMRENEANNGTNSVEKTLLQIQKTVAYLVKQNEELFLLIAIRQRNVENNEKNNSEEEKVINYWDEEWDVERLERSKVKRNGSATVTVYQINILLIIFVILINFVL